MLTKLNIAFFATHTLFLNCKMSLGLIGASEALPLRFAAHLDAAEYKLFELEPGMEEALAGGTQ